MIRRPLAATFAAVTACARDLPGSGGSPAISGLLAAIREGRLRQLSAEERFLPPIRKGA